MRRAAAFGCGAGVAILLLGAAPAAAQLRPLDPPPVELFADDGALLVSLGAGWLHGQRASLAGTSGTLREMGNLLLVWREGRFAVEAGGTVRRSLRDEERFAAPLATVTEPGPDRADTGDFRIGTLLRVASPGPADLFIRFGTRLPNSDDRIGLDRDRADFYGTVIGSVRLRRLLLALEGGVGIHGTHDLEFEQADPLLYSARAEHPLGPAVILATFLGQRSGFGGWVQRGNESLSELRVGVRGGRRHALELVHVVGLAEFSPRSGWLLTARLRR